PLIIWVWWHQYRHQGTLVNTSFGMIIGGALGNGYDRLVARFTDHFPGVRDFIHIDLDVWPFDPYPTFNIADSCICIGFALLLLASWLPARAAQAPDATASHTGT
ncbi:MAG: signal peptidase II, partial [Planctomycetota bacterium]